MALTIKQDRFAHLYVELGNASEAYRQAYDASEMAADTVWNEAYKLQQHPEVAAMIEAQRAATATKHAVTRESLAQELEEVREAALDAGQAAAAATAIMGKAKLYGLLVDKAEVRHEEQASAKPELAELLANAKAAGVVTTSGGGTKTAQITQLPAKEKAKATG